MEHHELRELNSIHKARVLAQLRRLGIDPAKVTGVNWSVVDPADLMGLPVLQDGKIVTLYPEWVRELKKQSE